MNIIILLATCLAYQTNPPQGEPPNIWKEITLLESTIQKAVKGDDSNFAISTNDPVHGYYVNHLGVFLVVPVRYRANSDMKPATTSDSRTGTLNLGENASRKRLDRKDIEKRMREWKAKLARNEMIKEANFEKVVSNMKALVPELIATLRSLPRDESVIIVVEEKVPAWYYAGFALRKNATRKVVTLTVDKDLISNIDTNETVLAGKWLEQIKRTTTNRQLVTDVLEGRKTAATED